MPHRVAPPHIRPNKSLGGGGCWLSQACPPSPFSGSCPLLGQFCDDAWSLLGGGGLGSNLSKENKESSPYALNKKGQGVVSACFSSHPLYVSS